VLTSGIAAAALPRSRTTLENQALVAQHLHVVRAIAHKMLRNMPRGVEVDDLIQDGMVGLLQAAQRYQGLHGASFSCYASQRIRGAIIDGSRRTDWCSRSLRRRIRIIEGARRRIEIESGMPAKPCDIAAQVGISLDDYHHALKEFSAATQLSLDAPETAVTALQCANSADTGYGPAEALEREATLGEVSARIGALPPLEGIIFSLYYEQEYRMHEIGALLALSESRVSQLHKRAMARLKLAAL